MRKFTQKDICMIIPTYNRAEDVERSLSTLLNSKNSPGKIIIVDQSKDSMTKKVVKKYSTKFKIDYIFSSTPSSSVAENIGVKIGKKEFPLLLICGDDLDFYPNYLNEMAQEFNNPKVMGVGGADIKTEELYHNSFTKSIGNFMLKLFFLPHNTKNEFKIVGPYGNTISAIVKETIYDAQWIPGFNNCFRREIYEDYSFLECKGYNVLEDIDCSYNVYRKFGDGSLVISPKCKVYHRFSTAARYPERKRIYSNHEDHFAFFYKHFNTFTGSLKMFWSLLGILIGNILRGFLSPKNGGFAKMVFNFQAIWYCWTHKNEIKQGRLREYLDDSLNMKE